MNKPSLKDQRLNSILTRYISLTLILIALVAILCAGCASTNQYARLAEAGTAYTAAVDRLLVTAANLRIDATSENLLQDDELKNQDLGSYRKFSSEDQERLKVIGRLRGQARLLARYFSLLNELASSDMPERAQESIEGVAKSLNVLDTLLRNSEIAKKHEISLGSLPKLILGFKIRGILKEELNKRKEKIQEELKTQEDLLRLLSADVQHSLRLIYDNMEWRLVINPLIATEPIVDPDTWIANRRRILTSQARIEELEDASDAARELREAFEDLVEGKLDFEDVNALLTDLESILAVVESMNR